MEIALQYLQMALTIGYINMSYSRRIFGNVGTISVEQTGLINDAGVTLTKGTPVLITSLGKLQKIDVSSQTTCESIAGLVKENINFNSAGVIIPSGTLENITTSASFGDILYISKTGDLTNIKPDIGVNSFVTGDFVIRIGVVTKNLTTPTNKDLLISISIIGQL